MESKVPILCDQCNHTLMVSQTKLASYYGKNIRIRCSHCKSDIPLKVDASLFTQKDIKPLSEPQTLVLAPKKGRSNKLASLHISGEFTPSISLPLKVGENIIGRTTLNTNDMKMSRDHCTIIVKKTNEGYSYFIKDNGSTNGTFIDEEVLNPSDVVRITANDAIRTGRTYIKLIT